MSDGYSGDDRQDRRREDREQARWRGSIDARVEGMDREVSELVATTKVIDRTVTALSTRFDVLQRDVLDYRAEIRDAATQINRGREESVKDLKDTIEGLTTDRRSWRITVFQVVAGAILALLVSGLTALMTLAISGQVG